MRLWLVAVYSQTSAVVPFQRGPCHRQVSSSTVRTGDNWRHLRFLYSVSFIFSVLYLQIVAYSTIYSATVLQIPSALFLLVHWVFASFCTRILFPGWVYLLYMQALCFCLWIIVVKFDSCVFMCEIVVLTYLVKTCSSIGFN